MLRSLMKSYRKNIRVAFMIAGVVYLAIILLTMALVRTVVLICGDNIRLMFDEIVGILNEYVSTFAIDSITQLPNLGSRIWQVIVTGTEGFGAQLVVAATGILMLLLFALAVAKSFGIYCIRSEGKPFGLLRGFLSICVRTILATAFVALFVWLATVWLYSAVILMVVWLFMRAVLNAFFVKLSGRTDQTLRELLRLKSLIPMQILYLVNFVFTVLVGVLLTCFMHVVIAALVLLPFGIYFAACTEACFASDRVTPQSGS